MIYLVDGYDEVVNINNSAMFDKFIQKILHSESTIIMTSRPLSSSQSLLNGFEVIVGIQPLSAIDGQLFAEHYFGSHCDSVGHIRPVVNAKWESVIHSICGIIKRNASLCSFPIVLVILCYIAKLEQERGKSYLLQNMSFTSFYDLISKFLVLAQIRRKKNIPLSEVDWDKLEEESENYFAPLKSVCFEIIGRTVFDRKTFNTILGTGSVITLDDYIEIGFVRKSATLFETKSNLVDGRDVKSQTNEGSGGLSRPNICYEFVHLSFVEYFAALSIVEQMNSEEGYRAFSLESSAGLFLYMNQYNETFVNFMKFIFGAIKDANCLRRFLDRLGENEQVKFISSCNEPRKGLKRYPQPNWDWSNRRRMFYQCAIVPYFVCLLLC
jgi:hypothetical protein